MKKFIKLACVGVLFTALGASGWFYGVAHVNPIIAGFSAAILIVAGATIVEAYVAFPKKRE